MLSTIHIPQLFGKTALSLLCYLSLSLSAQVGFLRCTDVFVTGWGCLTKKRCSGWVSFTFFGDVAQHRHILLELCISTVGWMTLNCKKPQHYKYSPHVLHAQYICFISQDLCHAIAFTCSKWNVSFSLLYTFHLLHGNCLLLIQGQQMF